MSKFTEYLEQSSSSTMKNAYKVGEETIDKEEKKEVKELVDEAIKDFEQILEKIQDLAARYSSFNDEIPRGTKRDSLKKILAIKLDDISDKLYEKNVKLLEDSLSDLEDIQRKVI